MIIANARTHNDMCITIDGHQVTTRESLKYLGLQLGSKWLYSAHTKAVAAKTGKVVQNLARIMPNISTAKSRKKKLLSNVVHSILLYGAPIWAQDMSGYNRLDYAAENPKKNLPKGSFDILHGIQ